MAACKICAIPVDDRCSRTPLCSRCSKLFDWFVDHFKEGDRRFAALDSSFYDMGIDSLDYIEWVSEAEDSFGVEIADEQAETLRTVGDYLAFIVRNARQQPESSWGGIAR